MFYIKRGKRESRASPPPPPPPLKKGERVCVWKVLVVVTFCVRGVGPPEVFTRQSALERETKKMMLEFWRQK